MKGREAIVSVKTSRRRVDAIVFNCGTVYKPALARLGAKTGGHLRRYILLVIEEDGEIVFWFQRWN